MKPELRKIQIARRAVQLLAVAVMLAIPVVARYHNYLASRELDDKLEKWQGSLQGRVLAATDASFQAFPGGRKERAGRMVRDRKEVLARAQALRGGPWSVELGPVSATDPLAAAESVAASRGVSTTLLWSLILPIAVTLLLGRVFCAWICPMYLLLEIGDKARGVLRFLEIRPANVVFSRGIKYALLAGGIVLAFLIALPILGAVYPPAVINREAHDLVFGIFDRAEAGKTGFWLGGLTWMSVILLGIVLFEIVVSRRWWCRYICPGGALYALLGAARLLRVRRSPPRCTHCKRCLVVCPMGLDPGADSFGPECDNCGLCISHCKDGALSYTVRPSSRDSEPGNRSSVRCLLLIGLIIGIVLAAGVSPLFAHHILGIPHYSYDEQYPQAPVLTYRVNAGRYEVRMTGYPGVPQPGERCTLHVYVTELEGGRPLATAVTLTARKDRLLGEDPIVYGPVQAELSDAVYKFYPQFADEANYTVRIAFRADGAPWTIDLPMVAGEPGSPWVVLGSVAAALCVFVVIVRALRIKRRRRLAP